MTGSATFERPVIETGRLRLRVAMDSDLPALASFLASERAAYVGGPVTEPRKHWDALARLAGSWLLHGFGPFVFTRLGEDDPLGVAGPWRPATWPEQEITWSIWAPEAEGTGLAFEAAAAARDFAFTRLGWTSAVSYIDPANARSVRLAERLGARRDDAAPRPHPEDLVYRHSPEAA